jgi:phytoene desaturase
LFTQPANIEELFLISGENPADHFEYQEVDVACNYFFENGTVIKAFKDVDRFDAEVARKLNERPGTVARYLKTAKLLYERIGKIFLDHSLHQRNTWVNKRLFSAISALRWSYLTSSLDKFNRKKFRSPEARQIFNRFATYNGSDPFRAPAMLSMIPHLEQNEGVYYPARGMISITQSIYDLAVRKGVKFYFNTPVQSIIHNEGRARGVVTKDGNIYADAVISNVDIIYTYKNLLRDTVRTRKILKAERSSSALIFFWGIRKQFGQLGLHNIFFSKDYQAEFRAIFGSDKIYQDPTVYVNISSILDAEHAPPGCANWFVMINVPNNNNQDWSQLIITARRNVISKLSRLLDTDLDPLIETEEIIDPQKLEAQTASYGGSLYGSSSNSTMSAFLRHPNFSKEDRGLFFCGGTVHPGGGIPLCLKSAAITARLVTQYFNK